MTLRVLRAPVGAGKTEHAQRVLLDVRARDPLARIWVLTATTRQELAFRQRIMARDGVSVLFNVEFFSFPTLYRHLLAMAGTPQRTLDDSARFALLRAVIESVQPNLRYFAPIAGTAGFARILADFFYELKQNLIRPETFSAAARTPKVRELALLYDAYQHTLMRDDIVDREGEGWLALEAAERGDLCQDVALLIADGYDQFNPLQARLLTTLGRQIPETIVTLTTAPEREQTVGRRFEMALEVLEAAAGEKLSAAVLPQGEDSRPPALRALTDRVFLSEATAFDEVCPEVHLIGAPDEAREVGMVLRRIRHLILGGARPDDIVIAVRDWARYGDLLSELGRAYNLPLALHLGQPLADNPAVRTLIGALELAQHDFPRRELLDLLRSPYADLRGIGLTPEAVDLIDAVSRAEIITAGKADWLEALDQWEISARRWLSQQADDPDEDHPPPPAAAYAPEHIAAARAALAAVFALLTPPAEAALDAWIGWIDALITPDPSDADEPGEERQRTGLHLPDQVRTLQTDELLVRGVIERDLAALETLMQVLRGLLGAEGLIATLRPEQASRRLTWNAFLRLLRGTIDTVSVQRTIGRDGRVLVTSVSDARGLPHRHVFIVGLSEGIFPAPVPEDRLLLDSERDALRRAGLPLTLQSERAHDDGLFYEMLSLAGSSLTLSRPMVRDGAPIPESHLWRSVRKVLPGAALEVMRADQVVAPDEVCTFAEAALAAADCVQREAAPPVYSGWLSQQPAWQRLVAARTVELRRMSSEPADQYAGRLHSADVRTALLAQFTPERRWSASQLNELAACGYQFFARRLLRLEPIKALEDGMDALQLGSLQHAILERAYRRIRAEIGVISPEGEAEALAVLDAEANAVFADAPAMFGFRPSVLWEKERAEILQRLRQLVTTDFSGDALPVPRMVLEVERAFIISRLSMRLKGVIDRIDQYGDQVFVIDYKSSSSGGELYRRAALERGQNVQLLIYLMALEDRFSEGVMGYFWHLGDAKLSEPLAYDDAGMTAMDAGKQHIARSLEAVMRADFSAQPARLTDGKCARYCEFSHLCRVSVMSRSKRMGDA